jgi:hypothetical protein
MALLYSYDLFILLVHLTLYSASNQLYSVTIYSQLNFGWPPFHHPYIGALIVQESFHPSVLFEVIQKPSIPFRHASQGCCKYVQCTYKLADAVTTGYVGLCKVTCHVVPYVHSSILKNTVYNFWCHMLLHITMLFDHDSI